MKKAKKLLALFLAVMMLFSGMSVGLGGIAVFAATNVTVDGVVDKTYTSTDDVIICVPETIYMTPSTGASVSGQYFVNDIVDNTGKVTLAADYADTTGQISIYAPGATQFSLNVTQAVGGIGDPVIGSSATQVADSYETTWPISDGYFNFDGFYFFINGTGVTAGKTALIQWKLDLTFSDGTTATYYAYSTLYSPYYYPIGAATRAKTNSKAFAQSIAWVSGVHGFTPNADDSKYWVAVTNETFNNESSDVTERGTYYVKTSGQAMVPLIYGVGNPGNTTSGVKDWLSTSAPGGGITVPTIRYFSLDNKSTNGGVMVVDISPVANLTVDTSRYNNLNQIPNFTVGYNVTDTQGADSVYWYVSDFTNVAHQYTTANSGSTSGKPCFFNWTKTTGKDDIDDYEDEWFNGPSTGSIITGSATTATSNYGAGVEWNTAWNRPLVTGPDHYDYMFKGAQHTYNGNRAYSINYVQLRVNNVDKSDLRSLVLKATSLNEQIYTTATWTPFISALQTAAQALGNPTASATDVTNAKNALQSAMNALKLNEYDLVFDNLINFNDWNTTTANNATISNVTDGGFTLTSNDGVGEGTSVSPFFPVTPGKQYKIDIDITGAAWDVYIFFCDENGAWVDFKDGTETRYSSPAFSGMHENHVFTAPSNDSVVKAQIRVDANDSNNSVTFKNIRVSEVGTVADGVSYVAPKTVTHGSTCSSLPTPTRPGYDFAGWAYADGTAVTASDKITANTNLYSTWTPATYTITFLDANGATYATDAYTLADTTITLPATNPTKTAYSFAGWVVDTAAGNWTSGETVTAAVASKYGNITVKPVWTPSNYAITFNTDGGSAVANVSYNIESTFTLPTTTKTAYDFAGWKVQTVDGNWSADTTYQAGSQSGKYGNVTLVAQWNPIAYTITYDANGGDAIAAVGYTIKDTVALPTPVKTGYTFAGWKVTSGTAGSWTAGTYNAGNVSSMYGDVTLQAQWTAIPYTITFVNWDDSVLQNTKFDYGTTPTPPADPTRDADNGYTYTFNGWEPTVSTVTGEATYKATYTATLIPYTITLDAGEGSVSDNSVEYNYESTSVTLPDAERAGYTFTGWTVKETAGSWTEGAAVNGTLSKAWGNVTLVANYTANEYTVTYNANNGTIKDENNTSFKATYDSAIGDLLGSFDVDRAGYTFAGWNTQADGSGVAIETGNVWTYTDVTTVYAQWTPIVYTLTLNNYNKETAQYEEGVKSTMTYTIETNLQLPCPERTGYDFDRWATGISVKGSWTKETNYTNCNMGKGNYGDATLTLYYTPKAIYTIKWYNGSDLLETDENVPYDSMPSYDGETPTQTPTETYAYEFTGWTPEVSAVTKDETYIATFKQVDRIYTVKFVDWNGNVISEQELKYNEIPVKPADPTREATAQYTYTFSTWKDSAGNTYNEILPVTADVTYTADYTASTNTYTITFINDDDSELQSGKVAYGETPKYNGTNPPVAVNQEEGYTYTFTGWDKEIATVTGDATYTAQYSQTANTYKLTLHYCSTLGNVVNNDYDKYYEYEFAYKETISGLDDATEIPGYAVAWGDNIPTTMPHNNVDVYAVYVTGCVVTWDIDGVTSRTAYAEGKSIEAPAEVPTKTGHTFSHWAYNNENGEQVKFPVTAGTDDLTIVAVFTANKYTITWKNYDGTVLETDENVPYGTATPTYDGETPTKAETDQYTYTHSGWTPAITSVTGDATYTATYTETVRSYTITWLDDAGNQIDTTTVEYGQTPTHAEPTKASTDQYDYTFAGWDPEIVAVTGDKSYTATYTEKVRSYTITWVTGSDTYTGTWAYGSTPVPATDGVDTSKASTVSTDYTFAGWDSTITSVTGNATYEAIYSESTRKYAITWDVDGVKTTEEVEYGQTPTHADPTKASTAQYSYAFAGWTPEVVAVTGTATYTAKFDAKAQEYTVTYIANGSTVATKTLAYGSSFVNYQHPAIPVKEGHSSYWNLNGKTTMPAEDVIIEAVYTANKYTVTWVADGKNVYEEQVVFGSAIPAKTVPAKAGNTGVWTDVPATMPAENVTITAEYSPEKYNVTWTFTTSSGSDIATYNETWSTTFTGYIPLDIRITVNGNLLSTDSYSYNADTGYLQIKGDAIIGNISITEKAVEGYMYVVISAVNATHTNNVSIVKEGEAFHTQLVPNEGYLLPEEIVVCINGVELNNGYSYDANTGKLTVNADKMYGELSIRFTSPVDPLYNGSSVKCTCGCHSSSAFVRFFWSIINFLRKLFGMKQYQYCDCGTAHW